jgi:hypothetical protein
LIEQDAGFIYSLVSMNGVVSANFNIMAMPYVEMFAMGAWEWNLANQIDASKISNEDKRFYNELRSNLKMLERTYDRQCSLIKREFSKSDEFFSGICNSIERILFLYNNIGAEVCNVRFCSNTIVNALCVPGFEGFTNFAYTRQHSKRSINYLTVFIYHSYVCKFAFKLRFGYILYFYLYKFIQETNAHLRTNFSLDGRWINENFRNSMAHYNHQGLEHREDVNPFDPMTFSRNAYSANNG